MEFEWDEAKAESNFAKHGVTFDEALIVFADPAHARLDARPGRTGEKRFRAVSFVGPRLVTVVHTPREGRIRLISARPANTDERKRYGDR